MYRATAVDVYGTTYPPATEIGRFGGAIQLAAGFQIEIAYAGSTVTAAGPTGIGDG
jgi:hypothetical protein